MEATNSSVLSLLDAEGNIRSLVDIEREAINFAIKRCNGNLSNAARELKIHPSTIYRKVEHRKYKSRKP